MMTYLPSYRQDILRKYMTLEESDQEQSIAHWTYTLDVAFQRCTDQDSKDI